MPTVTGKFNAANALPFGQVSPWIVPADAWCDTWLTDRFRAGIGINLNCSGAQAPAVCARLAAAGFRHCRIDASWGGIDYDTGAQNADVLAKLAACAANGLRPLLLVNSNDTAPTPTKRLLVTLAIPAAAAATAVTPSAITDMQGNPVEFAQFPLGRWGLSNVSGTGIAAECLFTSLIDNGTTFTLSQPLASPLPANTPLPGAAIQFAPFDAIGTANYAATLAGWVAYVQSVAASAAAIVGVRGFDLECWNELGFGSAFLSIANYYNPVPNDGYVAADVRYGILAATVQAVATLYPECLVGNGFANQSPFPSANGPSGAANPDSGAGATFSTSQAAPVGLGSLDSHPYEGMTVFDGTAATAKPGMWVNALGLIEASPSWYPSWRSFFPEYRLTAVQTEWQRNISPVGTLVYGVLHQRGLRPAGQAAPVQNWVTEYNLDPTPLESVTGIGELTIAAQQAIVDRFHAKVALRSFAAMIGKGFDRVYLFAVSDTNEPYGLGLIPQATLAQHNAARGDAPAIDAVGNLAQAMPPADVTNLSPLALVSISEVSGAIQWLGDPATAGQTPNPHPALRNLDCAFWQPYQATDTEYRIMAYVQTRDMSVAYADVGSGPGALDLPEAPYTFVASGFPAALTSPVVSVYDPITGLTKAGVVTSYSGGVLTFTANLGDYPRVIVIRPSGSAPVLINRRQHRLYRSTATILRPMSGGVNPATLDPYSTVYTLVSQNVPLFYEYTPNLDDPVQAARFKRPTEFTTDILHFAANQDVQNADIVVNTTPDNPNQWTTHRILGAAKNTPNQDRRRTNAQAFDAQRLEHPGDGVKAIVPQATG